MTKLTDAVAAVAGAVVADSADVAVGSVGAAAGAGHTGGAVPPLRQGPEESLPLLDIYNGEGAQNVDNIG